jgi:hypothetical protein
MTMHPLRDFQTIARSRTREATGGITTAGALALSIAGAGLWGTGFYCDSTRGRWNRIKPGWSQQICGSWPDAK